jgi:predicted nucleic-acid-binding Zn-ribbon protein
MLHRDIIPEQDCDGELIDVSDSKYLTTKWCSKCGTEFSYKPDSTWVTYCPAGDAIPHLTT